MPRPDHAVRIAPSDSNPCGKPSRRAPIPPAARTLRVAAGVAVAAAIGSALLLAYLDTRSYHQAIDAVEGLRPLMVMTAANEAADAPLLSRCNELKYMTSGDADRNWRDCMAHALPQLRSTDMALRASRQAAAWLRIYPEDAEMRAALQQSLRAVLPDAVAHDRINAATQWMAKAQVSSVIAQWSRDAVMQPQRRSGKAELRRAQEDAR